MIGILVNVRSLANVGSVFRTADALGCERIYLTGITPAPVDTFGNVRREVAKVSLGSENHVLWEKSFSAARVIEKLKKEGYRVLAVEQSPHSVPYHKVNPRRGEKIAIVMGSETKGLSPAILSKVHGAIDIPMVGIKESLNVAVAFGVVGFHLRYPR